MSAKHGNSGIVKISTNSVAEVQKWDYEDRDVSVQEKTSMGDTEAAYLASGCKGGGGTVECLLDATDANGQAAMTPGSTVTLKLYPAGDTSGDKEFSGSAIIETRRIEVAKDGLNKITFGYRGVLTEGTVV